MLYIWFFAIVIKKHYSLNQKVIIDYNFENKNGNCESFSSEDLSLDDIQNILTNRMRIRSQWYRYIMFNESLAISREGRDLIGIDRKPAFEVDSIFHLIEEYSQPTSRRRGQICYKRPCFFCSYPKWQRVENRKWRKELMRKPPSCWNLNWHTTDSQFLPSFSVWNCCNVLSNADLKWIQVQNIIFFNE